MILEAQLICTLNTIMIMVHISPPSVDVVVPVQSSREEWLTASREQTALKEMKPQPGLSLEHNPRAGFG